MKKFSFIKTRTGPEFTYPISDNAQWNKMHNPVSRTPHKALSSGFSLFIWKFVSISLGRDLNQRLPLLSWLSQYLLSSLKHQLLDSPDHTRIPNAISPLGYAEKLENQRTQREQKSAEKETTWFGGGDVLFNPQIYPALASTPCPGDKKNCGAVCPARGQRCVQGALPSSSERPWLCFLQKGLILQNRGTCSQTNHLVQRQRRGEEKVHLQALIWKGNKNLFSTPYLRKIRFAQQLSWGRDPCYSLRAVLTKDNGEGASPTKHKQ